MRFKDRPRPRVPIAPVTVVMLLLMTTMLVCGALAVTPSGATAAVGATSGEALAGSATGEEAAGSLESAATKAGETGRKVAMSLLGLALAVAAIVLAFRRDFKEAAGVFVVGVIAVLLATPAGLDLLKSTVTSLFGS